jgi:hypothetical protein
MSGSAISSKEPWSQNQRIIDGTLQILRITFVAAQNPFDAMFLCEGFCALRVAGSDGLDYGLGMCLCRQHKGRRCYASCACSKATRKVRVSNYLTARRRICRYLGCRTGLASQQSQHRSCQQQSGNSPVASQLRSSWLRVATYPVHALQETDCGCHGMMGPTRESLFRGYRRSRDVILLSSDVVAKLSYVDAAVKDRLAALTNPGPKILKVFYVPPRLQTRIHSSRLLLDA